MASDCKVFLGKKDHLSMSTRAIRPTEEGGLHVHMEFPGADGCNQVDAEYLKVGSKGHFRVPALGYLDVRIVDTDYSSFAVLYIYKELEGALSTMVQLYSECLSHLPPLAPPPLLTGPAPIRPAPPHSPPACQPRPFSQASPSPPPGSPPLLGRVYAPPPHPRALPFWCCPMPSPAVTSHTPGLARTRCSGSWMRAVLWMWRRLAAGGPAVRAPLWPPESAVPRPSLPGLAA
uniref:Lipocalin/cytosolic fatty-acid binding domain-containing protein n=1 Tax=Papio anubis TaxID=9555 RepID=A0A8I5NF00_PAPAN